MTCNRILRAGVLCLLGLILTALTPPADAAWVNAGATLFQVGGALGPPITPTANTTVDGTLVDPTCGSGSQGGTSLAIVQSSKLANVDAVHLGTVPVPAVLLVTTCLSNTAATAAGLNFLNPADGKVIKAISTTTTPSGGWVQLVNRPDKGDLLGCGGDGTIYSIDYSQFNTTADGTATSVPRPAGLPANCAALGWDAEEKMIYQGFSGNNNTIGVHRFKDGTTTDLGTFNTTCTPSGVAISGGVLLVECAGKSTILRLDKTSGALLGVNGTLGILGLAAGTNLNSGTGLGGLACDPVTFQRDSNGNDQFTDVLWSRQGTSGNGIVALEFPAFTCGLPSSSVVLDPTRGALSPLAAGLSAPDASNNPGAIPRGACFNNGKVVDSDGDGIPDCWEGPTTGIDFDGDGAIDFVLCASVNTNGDGVTLTQECADPSQKDLFAEVGWMTLQTGTTGFPTGFPSAKPDPLALSQPAIVTSVQSVRAAFAAAPVPNGIRIHLQVDPNPVTFANLANQQVSSVSELVFTPCTPPAIDPVTSALNVKSLSDAADYDAIKKSNFGAAEGMVGNVKAVNAKRLAFRYVLFAHNQTGAGGGGANFSGCSEVGGDDAAITLGSFAIPQGTTDQQAGTFMHEFGHTLGLRHGGGDNVNCKPNYLSVMSYSRQFAGSPIPGRRLDYSRAVIPSVTLPTLNETSLNEFTGLADPTFGLDPSLGAFTSGGFSFPADQTAYGPGAFSLANPASGVSCTVGGHCINWNKDKQGPNPKYANPVAADINSGPGCDGSGTVLIGHDDWDNLIYRASAALDFAGGARSTNAAEHKSITADQEAELFLAADLDANGIPDAEDCGFTTTSFTSAALAANATTVPIGTNPTFVGFAPSGTAFLGPIGENGQAVDDFSYTGTNNIGFTGVTRVSSGWPSGTTVTAACLHRIDIKPSDPTNTFSLGANATITVAIYSEVNGTQVWDATALIPVNAVELASFPLTFTGKGGTVSVVTNNNGNGTCSFRDIDPKDGIKDLLCQFPANGSLAVGTQYGEVRGFYIDPLTGEHKEFRARQLVTVTP